MRVVIANVSAPVATHVDDAYWARHVRPEAPPHRSLFDQRIDWGFHIYAIGLHLRDLGLAHEVEFWDYGATRSTTYLDNGVLRVTLLGPDDVRAYRARYGDPDLFINYGVCGEPLLRQLADRCFRVHVPCLRRHSEDRNQGAECYLVDDARYLDDRAMLYVPVVHTGIHPIPGEKERDFVYLASAYEGKRHDLLLDAVRGTDLSGHLHPVPPSALDLTGTRISTSDLDERAVVTLLRTSRIAVYPADRTSNPAAMWECVAAGLPIVVNADIKGGQHVVVPGVTGELAAPARFGAVMQQVLENRDQYQPRQHYERHWDTRTMLDRYLAFFERMGWRQPTCS